MKSHSTVHVSLMKAMNIILLTDYLYTTVKYFYRDRSGHVQDDPVPYTQGMRGVTKWFNEDKYYVNLVLWLNPVEHL